MGKATWVLLALLAAGLFSAAHAVPAAPTLTAPASGVSISEFTPTFSWSAVRTAVCYRLQIATDAGFANVVYDRCVKDVSHRCMLELAATTWRWRVQAMASNGAWGPWSAVSLFQVLVLNTTLEAPEDGATEAIGMVHLWWREVATAKYYEVELYDAAPATGTPILHNFLRAGCFDLNTPELHGGQWWWRVRVMHTNGTLSAWTPTFTFTAVTSPRILTEPANGASILDTTPMLWLGWYLASWPATEVQVDDDADFSSPHLAALCSNSTTRVSRPLAFSTTYYWRVRSLLTTGELKPWSEVWHFTVLPTAPTLAKPTNLWTTSDPTPRFQWSAVTNAVLYRLLLSKSSSLSPVVASVCTTSNVCDLPEPLSTAGYYYWAVRTLNANGQWHTQSAIRRFNLKLATGAGAVSARAVTTAAGGAEITVSLASPAEVVATVTNVAGVEVAALPGRLLPEGVSALLWDGRTRTGTPAPAGRYLVRVQARSRSGAVVSAVVPLLR